MTSMTKRLDVLEKANTAATAPARVIRLIASMDNGETSETAIARWCAENPDQPPPGEEDVIILRALVSPHRPISEQARK